MNNILLVQLAIGPTYKRRLLDNLNNCKSYDFFDVLVMTEDVEYFSSVQHRSNIIVKNIDEIRKNHPWSIELEKILPIIHSEEEYAKYYTEHNYKFPTLIERFAWDWEGAENYDGFIIMGCDVLPIMDDNWFSVMKNYFSNSVEQHPHFPTETPLKDKIIIVPGGSTYDEMHHGHLLDFAIKLNEKFKITNKKITHNFQVTDGNFKTFKFPNRQMIRPFFNILNNITHEILTNDYYFILRHHTMWLMHAEYIHAILFNLLDCQAFPFTVEWGLQPSITFAVNCYPEDRFWNFNNGMENSTCGREDYIRTNYDKLKDFYERHGQEFSYRREI